MIRLDYVAVVHCDTQPEAAWAAEQLLAANYEVEFLSETSLRATQQQDYEISNG